MDASPAGTGTPRCVPVLKGGTAREDRASEKKAGPLANGRSSARSSTSHDGDHNILLQTRITWLCFDPGWPVTPK